MRDHCRHCSNAPEVIRTAVLPSIRLPLSLRQVEDLPQERGSGISHETFRFQCKRCGPVLAAEPGEGRLKTARHPRPGGQDRRSNVTVHR